MLHVARRSCSTCCASQGISRRRNVTWMNLRVCSSATCPCNGIKSVFTWRHGGHIGVPRQWNGVLWAWTVFLIQTPSFVPVNCHRHSRMRILSCCVVLTLWDNEQNLFCLFHGNKRNNNTRLKGITARSCYMSMCLLHVISYRPHVVVACPYLCTARDFVRCNKSLLHVPMCVLDVISSPLHILVVPICVLQVNLSLLHVSVAVLLLILDLIKVL